MDAAMIRYSRINVKCPITETNVTESLLRYSSFKHAASSITGAEFICIVFVGRLMTRAAWTRFF